jgi:hypothetical protein
MIAITTNNSTSVNAGLIRMKRFIKKPQKNRDEPTKRHYLLQKVQLGNILVIGESTFQYKHIADSVEKLIVSCPIY